MSGGRCLCFIVTLFNSCGGGGRAWAEQIAVVALDFSGSDLIALAWIGFQ